MCFGHLLLSATFHRGYFAGLGLLLALDSLSAAQNLWVFACCPFPLRLALRRGDSGFYHLEFP